VGISVSSILLVLVGLVAQDSEPNDRTVESEIAMSFSEAMSSGADCATLIEAKNVLKRAGFDGPDVYDQLRSVGCYSTSSTRVEPRSGNGDVYSLNYKTSWISCSLTEELYAEARTTDPVEASTYVAQMLVAGEAYQGAYDGCFDRLTGQTNRYP
jgi:hypothetical protein